MDGEGSLERLSVSGWENSLDEPLLVLSLS